MAEYIERDAVLQIITAKRPGYQDIAEYYQQYLNNDYRNN